MEVVMGSVFGFCGRVKRSKPLLATVSIALLLSAVSGCKSADRIAATEDGKGARFHPLVSRPPRLRIGIVRKERKIELYSRASISLESLGRHVLVPERSEWVFEVRDSVPARISYHVCVASFRSKNRDEALKAVKEWNRQGYSVELIETGRKLRIGGHLVDNRIYTFSVGVYRHRADAVRERERLSEGGVDGWIEEQLVEYPRGTIAVHYTDGTRVGQVSSPIHVTSDLPITVKNVNFGFWNERREDRTYEWVLEISVGKDGALQVTELVDLETYLSGVVPSEMPASWPEAALQVQAVAARTETLAKMGARHVADGFDLCATVHCQAYGGLTRRAPTTTAAVEATRGEVLMDGARPVDTVYSLNCGGHTENVENVWSLLAEPALRGKLDELKSYQHLPSPIGEREIARWVTTKPDVACSESSRPENFRWRKTYRADELNAVVAAKIDVGNVLDVIPLDRGVSGRLKSVQVVGTRGEKIVRKELAIRSLFGGLFSAAFIVEIERDGSGKPVTVTFVGAGRGHGVGMCQDGARGRASRGATYREILTHYYTRASIVKLY